jgi:hypothetical protein
MLLSPFVLLLIYIILREKNGFEINDTNFMKALEHNDLTQDTFSCM